MENVQPESMRGTRAGSHENAVREKPVSPADKGRRTDSGRSGIEYAARSMLALQRRRAKALCGRRVHED